MAVQDAYRASMINPVFALLGHLQQKQRMEPTTQASVPGLSPQAKCLI